MNQSNFNNITSNFTLNSILAIEDADEILNFKCPNTSIPIWSMIRIPFFRMIIGDLFFDGPIGRIGVSHKNNLVFKGFDFIRAYAHNFITLKKIKSNLPILIMATGGRYINRGGLYFNTLGDYFFDAAVDRSVAIERVPVGKWPFPRYHTRTLLHTTQQLQGALAGKIKVGSFRNSAVELVELISERAQDILGFLISDERKKWLIQVCSVESASLYSRYIAYQSIYKNMGTKLIIKEEACYGGADNAASMKAARDMGIVTAEFQHGMISSGHDAYNFASNICESEQYQQTLPEYLLTYGAWWGSQIRAPLNKIIIGNPHKSEIFDIQKSMSVDEKKSVLILGDGIDTNRYLNLCDIIFGELGKSYNIIFRPHPLEREGILKKYPNGFYNEIKIDSNSDIYISFQGVDVIISETSTALFEALGRVRNVFVWSTTKSQFYLPSHPFKSFDNESELLELIKNDSAEEVRFNDVEIIWAEGWRKNYLNFITEVVRL